MRYVKKSEVKKKLNDILSKELFGDGYIFDKSRSKYIKLIKGGAKMIETRVLDSYNFELDEVEWKIEIYLYVRHDVIHDWFLPFENRSEADLKFRWTFGLSVYDIMKEEFVIDVVDEGFEENIYAYIKKFKVVLGEFFHKYLSLSCLCEILIERDKRFFNFRTAMENLTVTWLFDRQSFDIRLQDYLFKLKNLRKVGDPMTVSNMPIFDEIISSLKSFNFTTYDFELCDE